MSVLYLAKRNGAAGGHQRHGGEFIGEQGRVVLQLVSGEFELGHAVGLSTDPGVGELGGAQADLPSIHPVNQGGAGAKGAAQQAVHIARGELHGVGTVG